MPNLQIAMMRGQTAPGDMLIKINTGGIISKIISRASDSQFVHGGLAVGQNQVIEVNGGLSPDKLGNGRLLANIYITSLFSPDLRRGSYVCYRCMDTDLATQVAIEAYPFARQGYDKRWGYDVGAAIASTPIWQRLFGVAPQPTGQFLYIGENESVLAAANHECREWFCTQWIVWMYFKTAEKMRKGFSFPLEPKVAYPGALVDALDRSTNFTYMGVIAKIG
jgi:hypothetical protein